jgi:two-component system response regulator RegA
MTKPSLEILIVEDDAVLAQALSKNLRNKGHHVSHCATVAELQLFLQQGRLCDLVLLDLKLEHETTLDQISQLRSTWPSSKIFMITAYASIATTVDAIKKGADDYLPKPFSSSDILQAYYKGTNDAEVTAGVLSPKRLEWEHIQRVLNENDGNISQTAKQLNMHRRTLQRKLQKKPQQN